MSEQGYFAAPDPDDFSDGPRLPETYLTHSLEGMPPRNIVHLVAHPGIIHADAGGEVYIDPSYAYNPVTANNPDYENGDPYIAIMRLYEQAESDGALLDGYIIDTRLAPPGAILTMDLTDSTDEQLQELLGDRCKALGIITLTEDGQTAYRSARRQDTIAAAQYLGELVDELCLGTPIDEVLERRTVHEPRNGSGRRRTRKRVRKTRAVQGDPQLPAEDEVE